MLHWLSTNLTGVLLVFIMQRPSQHTGCWETDNSSMFFLSVSSLSETQPAYRVISGLAVSDIVLHIPISLFSRLEPTGFSCSIGNPRMGGSAAAASEDYKDLESQYGNMPNDHIF